MRIRRLPPWLPLLYHPKGYGGHTLKLGSCSMAKSYTFAVRETIECSLNLKIH